MHPGLTAVSGVTLLLVGQPNAGKTTLFNALTGSHARTANYPGATVEYSIGTLLPAHGWGAAVQIIDLPGLASLVPRSLDEEVTVRSLYGQAAHERPDLAIVVADCSQLSRHLYLAKQVLATGIPTVLAVTMSDLLAKRGYTLDARKLEEKLGCPVAIVDGRSGEGLQALLGRAKERLQSPVAVEVKPVLDIPVDEVKTAYREIEGIEQACLRLAMAPPKPSPTESINESAQASVSLETDPDTRRIDAVLLHPVFGLIAFGLSMALLFTGVFWLARPLMDAISGGCDSLATWIVGLSPSSFLLQLLGDGIVRGAGGVLVFLPQIVILFFGMGLMEDSGYLARAAVLVDRPLAMLGLNGRSFVPLLSGFACAIPGMMAARTIPNRRERLLTIFIMPLMSCSARLPVYALLLAFLTPADRPWLGGLALTLVYFVAVASGAITAAVVSRFVPQAGHSAFMLELPVYRRPQLKVIARSTYHRSKLYLTKAGVPILIISMALWLFCHLPRIETAGLPAEEAASRQMEGSYAAGAGHLLEPVMRPLGLDWRVGVALIAAFAAREVFVGSLAIIFHVTGEGEEAAQAGLISMMQHAKLPDGSALFTTATSVGLIVFFIFAMQCMSTAAVARREAGGWWMPVVQTFAFTGFAYVAAWATVQGLRSFGVA